MAATLKLDLIVDDKANIKIKGFTDGSVRQFKRLEKIIDNRLGNAVRSFGRKSRSAINSLGKAVFSLKGAIAAIGVGFLAKNLAGGALSVASNFEKMKLSLDTITKGEGAEWFEKLNEWALKMPVNTEKAIQSFTMMRAMGLKPSIKQMTTLVDTMSALGGGADVLQGIARALGQMATKGKVSAEELMQLAERGVPVFEILKDKFGEVETSSLDAREAIAAIFEGMEDRFGGQAEKMQSTWAGMMETLRSYWKEFQRLVMESGVMDFLKEKLGAIVRTIDDMAKSGKLLAWAEKVGGAISGLFNMMDSFFTEKWPAIESYLRHVPALFNAIKVAVELVAKAFWVVGDRIGWAMAKLVDFYEAAQRKIKSVTQFLGLGSTVKPLGEKIDEMAGKMQGFADLSNKLTIKPTADFSEVSKRMAAYAPGASNIASMVGSGGKLIHSGPQGGGYQPISQPIMQIKQFQAGTDYVPKTGLAMLHEGEKVIPAGKAGRNYTINVNYSGGGAQEQDVQGLALKIRRELVRLETWGM